MGIPVEDYLPRLTEVETMPSVGSIIPWAGILDYIKRRK